MDPLEVLARLDNDADAVPTSELDQAQADLRDLIGQATDGDEPDVELADELAAALGKISEVLAARAEASEAARARAAEIRANAGIVEETEETEEAEEAEAEQVPVAASASAILERLRSVANSRPVPEQPVRRDPDVIAKGVGPAAGADVEPTFESIAEAFTASAQQTGRTPTNLVQIRKHFTPDRILGGVAHENTAKLNAVAGPRPVTASGGLCGPGDVDHSVGVCGDRGRPVRDGLVSFMASRGSVRFQPWPSLGDLDEAVAVWTEATDADPGENVKPCPHVDCPDEGECVVAAITACLTVGNFQAKFSPEFWAAQLELLMVTHDRLAEQTLLATIDAGSTTATTVTGNGTTSNFAQTLDRWVNYYRTNLRILGPLTGIFSTTLRRAVASDLAFAEFNGDYSAGDAAVNAMVSARGVTPVWTPDSDENVNPGTFPAATTMRLFPTGSWVFLDGGTIDLGTNITDSVLNATNDRQAFMETFEAACHRGCESLEGDLDLEDLCGCPVPAGE